MKTLIIILMLTNLTIDSLSLDTISTKYFPLKIGNAWTYAWTRNYPPPLQGRYKVNITHSLFMNNHIYYYIYYHGELLNGQEYFEYVRIDSVYGRYLKFTSSGGCPWLQNEVMFDSLAMNLSNVSKGEFEGTFCLGPMYCDDTSIVNIFGISRPSKKISYSGGYYAYEKYYVKDIGLTHKQRGAITNYSIDLIGCIIDEVLYGDTSLIGINNISSEIPVSFSLSQNYPNPFNPTTKIKFALPPSPQGEGLGVRVVVYDVLGREVQTLVNEQLSAGTYEVDFDGTNYPSGVYYYILTAGEFKETKKMVLIK